LEQAVAKVITKVAINKRELFFNTWFKISFSLSFRFE